MKTNPNESAFPVSENELPCPGVSKREYFVAMALQGIAAQYAWDKPCDIASKAIICADEIINQLNGQDKHE